MKAMVLNRFCNLRENKEPLKLVTMPSPVPSDNEILIRVTACGVCHTELDEIEGRSPPPKFPIVLGHQIIGNVDQTGKNARHFKKGDRV